MTTISEYQSNEKDDNKNNQELLTTFSELISSSYTKSSEQNELIICLLEKIAKQSCTILNEVHWQRELQKQIAQTLESFYQIYKAAHPAEAAQYERIAQLEAALEKCCPKKEPDPICKFVPCDIDGGIKRGNGFSTKSKGYVNLVKTEQEHEPWIITPHTLNDNEILPKVPQGRIIGPIIPAKDTPNVLDFRSGSGSGGGGSEEPVSFRTFTNSGVTTNLWPPDMSGAKGGDVVVMSGNLWLKLSVDGGQTFTDLDFTKIFAADTTYGGWAGDQVIHYVPSIDCFVLYVQSSVGSGANSGKSVVKVALASPADLKKFSGAKQAWWRQWDFNSDTFGLSFWMDFPDISYGDAFLYIDTNIFNRTTSSAGKPVDSFQGKLFFELPLKDLQAGNGFSFQYAFISDKLTYSSPTQNINDENYWAAHVDNVTMRIYSSKGTDTNYFWRDRTLGANWPTASGGKSVKPEDNEDNIVSAAPDSTDWISEDHRIIGATKVGNILWFGWTAASGDGGAGGFKFPQPHIQIAKFDISQDYKFMEQTQIWNANNAFAYPCLTTNSDNEVGISLSWGGGSSSYGSHAVGIFGDFVVWFGEASTMTSTLLSPTRFGDYVHVRLAQPDTRFFSAFGYAVIKGTAPAPAEKADYLYVEFGRNAITPSPVR